MSINDMIEDLKSEIKEAEELLSVTEDEETKTILNNTIWNLNQEINNIFKIISDGKSR